MATKKKYTPELAAEVCRRLAEGQSLKTICDDPAMPCRRLVNTWVSDDVDGFAARYACAREDGLDTVADDILNIADDGRNDWMENADPDNPGYRFNGENVQRSRVRVEARKWYLSKLMPKKYGDKTSMELTGADGGPVQITDTERAARIAAILANAKARRDAVPGQLGGDGADTGRAARLAAIVAAARHRAEAGQSGGGDADLDGLV